MQKNHLLFIPLGMIFLTIALALKVYASNSDIIDFLTGLFIGLSIAINLLFVYFQVRWLRKTKS